MRESTYAVKDLLKSSSFWVINKTLVSKLGIEAAFLLSVLAEAEQMFADADGWFFQTIEDIEKLTTLTRRKQEAALRILEDKGTIQMEVRGVPPKRHFQINYERVTNQFAQNVQIEMDETYKLNCAKRTDYYKEHTDKERTDKTYVSAPVSKCQTRDKLDYSTLGVSDEVITALKGFSEMRTAARKPLTQRALVLNVNKLVKLSGGDERVMVEIVNQSIERGWQGLFAVQEQGGYSAQRKPYNMGNFNGRDYSDEDMEAFYEDVSEKAKQEQAKQEQVPAAAREAARMALQGVYNGYKNESEG